LERFLDVIFCQSVKHSLRFGLDLLSGIKPESFQLQFRFWKYEEVIECQITSDDPVQEGFIVGGGLKKFSTDVDALLFRHRSHTRIQINEFENCPSPPSYAQLDTLAH
jgi:hypothetical protein